SRTIRPAAYFPTPPGAGPSRQPRSPERVAAPAFWTKSGLPKPLSRPARMVKNALFSYAYYLPLNVSATGVPARRKLHLLSRLGRKAKAFIGVSTTWVTGTALAI